MMKGVLSRLNELTDLKEAHILDILEQTKRQRTALLEENLDEMLQITDTKQEVINQINQIDEEFEEAFRRLGRESKSKAVVLKGKISAIQELMEQIAVLENENKQDLIEKMNDVKKHIQQIKAGKRGMNAYFKNNVAQSIYMDHKK